MILSFKTKINGKPTYFPQKIIQGLYRLGIASDEVFKYAKQFPGDKMLFDSERAMKIHTIRKDDKGRWNEGMMIDFFINARQKDMFRFAPKIEVKSIQFIGINPAEHEVNIDGKFLFPNEIETLAINDGFDSTKDFFEYFNEEFHGIIIHWTDLKY